MKQRRCPKIQKCPTCGRMRVHHPGNRLYDCPVPKAVTLALGEYARTHGRNWRAWLVKDWNHPGYFARLNPELQSAKTLVGPHRLRKIDPRGKTP